MPKGIMIFGPSGAGKTALGRLVAQRMEFTFIDIDDYIWRWDTERPFTELMPREMRIERLMRAAIEAENFIMAGSMDSFHEPFDPLFRLAVFLTADAKVRMHRVHMREFQRFGERILKDGDMYEEHQRFLADGERYDVGGGSTCFATHNAWAESLNCPVLRLDGAEDLDENAMRIQTAYRTLV